MAGAASAVVPQALVRSTTQAATRLAAGHAATAGLISAQVAALTEEVVRSMLLSKLKLAGALALLLALGTGGIGLLGKGLGASPTAGSSVALSALALNAPARAKPKPAITAANAAQVRTVGELAGDAWEILWGPKPGELTLLGWEEPAEVFDAATLRSLRKIGRDQKLIHLTASADGETLAWCENTTQVEVRRLRTEKNLIIDTKNSQPQMALSADGKLLATGGSGTQAALWDAVSGKLVRSLDAGPEGGLTVVFSADGGLLAVGNRNGATRLYDVASGKLVHTLVKTSSHELKFNPAGTVLAVAYVDGTISLWDVGSGELRHESRSDAPELYALDWNPKGDVLVTSGREGKITLWDPRALTVLKELEAPEWVIRVRFSPDGSRLVSAGGPATKSPERKVVLWGVPEP
jgi:hypothetical protein